MPPTLKLIVKDKGWNKIKTENKKLNGVMIKSGLFGDGGTPDKNVAARGAIQEYGIPKGIRVTDKMRGYLRFIGIRIRDDTKKIYIPSRPFTRRAFSKNLKGNKIIIEKWYTDFLNDKISLKTLLNRIGLLTSDQIKMSIKTGSYRRLHPVTKKLKGSTKPLVDSSVMVNKVKYKITKKGL